MKKLVLVLLLVAVAVAFSQPVWAGGKSPCAFKKLKSDRKGWERFQCPDCSVVSVKYGPWSMWHVAKTVCSNIGPGRRAQIVIPKNRKSKKSK